MAKPRALMCWHHRHVHMIHAAMYFIIRVHFIFSCISCNDKIRPRLSKDDVASLRQWQVRRYARRIQDATASRSSHDTLHIALEYADSVLYELARLVFDKCPSSSKCLYGVWHLFKSLLLDVNQALEDELTVLNTILSAIQVYSYDATGQSGTKRLAFSIVLSCGSSCAGCSVDATSASEVCFSGRHGKISPRSETQFLFLCHLMRHFSVMFTVPRFYACVCLCVCIFV
jgi:hypothetical protein